MTLECETRRPAKRVTWLKGMVELRSGRKYVMRQRGVVLSLTITCLEKSDADIYICDVGTMQSRAQLTVQGETRTTEHCLTVVMHINRITIYMVDTAHEQINISSLWIQMLN